MSRLATVISVKTTMDEQKQDADLQSDEQSTDLVVDVPVEETADQAPDKEDPSDKMTPEHPRFKEVLDRAKTAEERAEELERRIIELEENKQDDGSLSPDEKASLDKIKRELAKDGYVTQGDLRVQRNAENLRKLSEKYTGKEGLPAFERADVVAFAKKEGYGDNYEAAYRQMHFDAIVEVESKKKASAPQAPEVEKPSGGGEATTTKRFTREDIKNMSDPDYDKYRTGLLQALKPK
jgi:hypothetical protein